MPRRSDVAYLQEKAEQFRRLAPKCDTTVAAKLREMAIELEAKAAELEAREQPGG